MRRLHKLMSGMKFDVVEVEPDKKREEEEKEEEEKEYQEAGEEVTIFFNFATNSPFPQNRTITTRGQWRRRRERR